MSAFFVHDVVLERGACSVAQRDLAARFTEQMGRLEGAVRAAQTAAFVHDHSGIARRSFEVPLDAIDRRTDWYRLVNEATESLARRTLEKLFATDEEARRADALVVVTSSHGGFPGLSRRLQETLRLPLDAACVDLAALGCAGATQGWLMTHALLASENARRAVLLLVDVMGTFAQSRRHPRVPSTEQLVAHCLASDGAAALSIGREPGARHLFAYSRARLSSRLWPESLHLNDLTADHDNLPFLSVGGDIRTRVVGELASQLGEDPAAEPIFFHPGGAALMSALVRHEPRLADTAAVSMSVLEENGNVGSSSAVWVLERAIARGMPIAPRFRLVALGPGIVTTILEVDGVKRGDA